MVFNAVNDSIRSYGISPTLAVYGATPRLGLLRERQSLSTHQRSIAVKKETHALTKHFSSRQVHDAPRTRNGPNVTSIFPGPIGSHALVYKLNAIAGRDPKRFWTWTVMTCMCIFPMALPSFV